MRLPLHEWTAALLAWNTQVKQANKQNQHERKPSRWAGTVPREVAIGGRWWHRYLWRSWQL